MSEDEEKRGGPEAPGSGRRKRDPARRLGMAGRRLTAEQYEIMLESHRRDPGNIKGAARKAGVNWRTAHSYWEGSRNGFRPIKEVIEQERTVRRALVSQSVEEQEAAAQRIRGELEQRQVEMLGDVQRAKGEIEAAQAQLRELVTGAVGDVHRSYETLMKAGAVDKAKEYEREGRMARTLQTYVQSVVDFLALMNQPAVLGNLMSIILEDAARKDLPAEDARRIAGWIMNPARLKAVGDLVAASQQVTRTWLGQPTQIGETKVTVALGDVDALLAEGDRIAAQIRKYRTPPVVEDAVLEPQQSQEPPALPPAEPEKPEPTFEEALAAAQEHWAERDEKRGDGERDDGVDGAGCDP